MPLLHTTQCAILILLEILLYNTLCCYNASAICSNKAKTLLPAIIRGRTLQQTTSRTDFQLLQCGIPPRDVAVGLVFFSSENLCFFYSALLIPQCQCSQSVGISCIYSIHISHNNYINIFFPFFEDHGQCLAFIILFFFAQPMKLMINGNRNTTNA